VAVQLTAVELLTVAGAQLPAALAKGTVANVLTCTLYPVMALPPSLARLAIENELCQPHLIDVSQSLFSRQCGL